MKFGAFQRSQGEVQQNVKPRSPRSTSNHVDPVGRSPCQVGPAGRPVGPLPSRSAPLCSQLGHVLRVISLHIVARKNLRQRGQFAPKTRSTDHMRRPAGPSTAPPPAQVLPRHRPWDPINNPLLVPCKHTPHLSRIL
jgi:hypothetical protein